MFLKPAFELGNASSLGLVSVVILGGTRLGAIVVFGLFDLAVLFVKGIIALLTLKKLGELESSATGRAEVGFVMAVPLDDGLDEALLCHKCFATMSAFKRETVL